MSHTPLVIAGAIAKCLICCFAIIAGSWRERMGGVVYLIDYVLNFLLGVSLIKLLPLRFLIADSVCLIGFVYLCWKSPLSWPLWAIAFQFLSVMTDLAAVMIGDNLLQWTFLTIHLVTDNGVLIVLLVGTGASMRMSRRAKIPQ